MSSFHLYRLVVGLLKRGSISIIQRCLLALRNISRFYFTGVTGRGKLFTVNLNRGSLLCLPNLSISLKDIFP